MPLAITVQVRGLPQVQRFVNKLPNALQEDIGDANFNYTTIVRDNLRKQLNLTSKRWRNKIYNGIKAKKQSKFTSHVTMPIEGIWLDGMKPHWVSLKRGRLITQWAKDRGIKARGIFVKPHPFINRGLANSRNRLPKEIKKGVRKAFRRSRT